MMMEIDTQSAYGVFNHMYGRSEEAGEATRRPLLRSCRWAAVPPPIQKQAIRQRSSARPMQPRKFSRAYSYRSIPILARFRTDAASDRTASIASGFSVSTRRQSGMGLIFNN